jgi:hypothetical protein
MKFIWEENDIKAGTKYSREGLNEVWMIGYMSDFDWNDAKRRHVHVSMEDGMVTTPYNRAEMASMLNEGKYVPLKFLGRE